MLRCQKCQNVKTLKANDVIFSKTDTCVQSCANFAQHAQKIVIFYYPLLLQCIEIVWVNFSKNKGMGMKFNIENALLIAANIILRIYVV